jgi:hypothetical protein
MAKAPPLQNSTSSVTDLICRLLPTYFGAPPSINTSTTATVTSTTCQFKSVLPSSHNAASVGDTTLFGGSSGDPPSGQYKLVLPSLSSHNSIGGSIESGPTLFLAVPLVVLVVSARQLIIPMLALPLVVLFPPLLAFLSVLQMVVVLLYLWLSCHLPGLLSKLCVLAFLFPWRLLLL